jgi:hypothetical protein
MQPGCTPSPAVTQDGDLQFDGGEKQTGLRPLPLPQLQGFSSSVLGRCNALNLGVEFFLLFSHQIRALLSFLFPRLLFLPNFKPV